MTTVGSTPSILPGDPAAQGLSLGFPSEHFWSTPINELLVDVQSSSAGLTDDEAARRLLGFCQEHRAAGAVDPAARACSHYGDSLSQRALSGDTDRASRAGDVVSLSAGATIPGDARLLEFPGAP